MQKFCAQQQGSNIHLDDHEQLYKIIADCGLPLCIENNYIDDGYKLVLGSNEEDTNNYYFQFEPTKFGYQRIMVFHSGLYLNSNGQTDGCLILQTKKNDKTSQEFRLERVRDDQYLIRARNSSKVFTIENPVEQKTGTRICQKSFENLRSQLFRIDSVKQ